MKRLVVLLLFVASRAHAGLPTRSDCARMLGVDPATGRTNQDLIPKKAEPKLSARENFDKWLYPAPQQTPVKQPFHYFTWHPFAKTRDAKKLAMIADEVLTKPKTNSNTTLPRGELSEADKEAGKHLFLGEIEKSGFIGRKSTDFKVEINENALGMKLPGESKPGDIDNFAAKLHEKIKAGNLDLKLPVEGRQRSGEEIAAWTEYLKTAMDKPDFTVEELFGILDVGFSSRDFQFSQMLNDTHVDKIEFVRNGTKFQRIFKKADGYAKSGANLDVKDFTKIMSTQLKFKGEIPSDPQGIALWIQDVTRVLHSGAKQALGQSVDTAFDLKGRKAAKIERDRIEPKAAAIDEGAYKIMRELDQYIVDSYARAQNASGDPLSPRRLGFLPADSKVVQRYDYMKDLSPHLYFRLKVYIKALMAGKALGPLMDYVGLAGDWMKPANPTGTSPLPLDGKRKYTKAELELIRSRARANMVHYLNGKIVEKWAPRAYLALGAVQLGMLGMTLYESNEEFDEAYEKNVQTTDKKDETNTNIKEGPGIQYASKDKELEALDLQYQALVEEHKRDKQSKSPLYKAREKRIEELYKQLETLSGELDGALQD